MSDPAEILVHATSVAIGDSAVLIEGPSGAGKSDLALRLIDRGAILISDDYTRLYRVDDHLIAASAPHIAGKIEVRGIGIVEYPAANDIPVKLIVDVGALPERLPQGDTVRTIADVQIPIIALVAWEASAAIKVELALKQIGANAS